MNIDARKRRFRPPAADAEVSGAAAPSVVEVSEKPLPTPDTPAPNVTPKPQTDKAAPLHCRIEIQSAVHAEIVDDRHALNIRGRVVSMSPVLSVALLVDGAVAGEMLYNQPDKRPDGAPSRGLAITQQFFVLVLSLPVTSATGPRQFVIEARGTGGQAQREHFALTLDAANPREARVTTGQVQSSASPWIARPPVLLHVERATVDQSGQVVVQGWAIALSALTTLDFFVNDDRLGAAVLGGEREDVVRSYATYPNAGRSGFSFQGSIATGSGFPETIRAVAASSDGCSHSVMIPLARVAKIPEPPPRPPSEPVRDLRRQIRLQCDTVGLSEDGDLIVEGWAVSRVGITAVEIVLNGELIGEAVLGGVRPDVGQAFPNLPLARFAGYGFKQPIAVAIGAEYQVQVVARNDFGDTTKETRTLRVLEASKPAPTAATPPLDETSDFICWIDNPRIHAGVAQTPVTDRLTIEGWALARSGIKSIEILIDGQAFGLAKYGTARRDVAESFPSWNNAIRSGFFFTCPPRKLIPGPHTIRVIVHANDGGSHVIEFRADVKNPLNKDRNYEDQTTIRRRISPVEADVYQDILTRLAWQPSFRLVLRLGRPLDIAKLRATVASLRGQIYGKWELLILADETEDPDTLLRLLRDATSGAPDPIGNIDAAALDLPFVTERAVNSPLLLGFLCPGDELGCNALAEMAVASGIFRGAEVFYADEDRLSPATNSHEPFFKPSWSPDLLLSTNYIGRPWFATAEVFARTGLTPRQVLQYGEFDAVLRCTESAAEIQHIPKLLCRRDTASLDSEAIERTALRRAGARRGVAAEVLQTLVPGSYRFKPALPATGKVSIIIPTCATNGYIKRCIEGLREGTAYRNFEIICVDNIPEELTDWKIWLRDNADKVVVIPEAFNWSRFNNRAAELATGEYLLFLNDDVEIITEDWLHTLLEQAARPDVGIVGARLLYPDRTVQHAGVFLTELGRGRHAFRCLAEDEGGYFGLALTQRNVIAVTGACILTRSEVFRALDGFNELHDVINNDLDYCLRIHAAGLRTVYTPHAVLIHHELASRANMKDDFDVEHFSNQWRTLFAAGDPYYSPHLTKSHDDFSPDLEATRPVYVGYPKFRHNEIKRILAVKLDHIGDVITSLPAIRRLKRIFPEAKLYLLASRAVSAFVAAEPDIEEVIDFEFFYPNSGLGVRELTETDFQSLSAKLSPYGFDLAVDLRKYPETRDVLRYTGARYLAGYEYAGRFPWLDVALELENSAPLQRKRNHVGDDLLQLVTAIATACDTERTGFVWSPQPSGGDLKFLSASARKLFSKPVVAVHPGVGQVMRQWPAVHFAALIDLLITKNDVNVVLIGSPDESSLGQEVLSLVSGRRSVVSLVGKTALKDLPALLQACALFVGNNSGPQHIAAGLGVPTIGIHSGVVDATEWGPAGPRAVAIQRNMVCSPCHLIKLEDCVRGLTCLNELYPEAVHRYCEMFLARPAGAGLSRGRDRAKSAKRR